MEFDRDKYRELLLSSIPSARKASDGNEVVCRCFYCPDSKDLSHGHFYISIPSNDNPSMFYCQKCQTCGFVTHETLMEWGIYDVDISASLASIFGIKRGLDFVFIVGILGTYLLLYKLYNMLDNLENELTDLVRKIALKDEYNNQEED